MKDVGWMATLAVLGISFVIIAIGAMVQWRRRHKQNRSSGLSAADKPLWGNGEEIFAEEWVLKLRVGVPKDVMAMSCNELEQFYEQLSHYHSVAMTATEYFSDGIYFVRRNGTMCRIVDGGIRKGHYAEVSAVIDLEDLPHNDVFAQRLLAKPATATERAKNCVLLDVQAHGTGKKKGEAEFPCQPRFAVRNGKIIVESY